MNSVVTAAGLSKRYDGLVAVDGVSFDVSTGSCFGFLGPNGAGKTTTMRMIACSLPPTSGRLHVLGKDVRREPRAIKARLGVVPQEDNLDEEVTVLDNLFIYGRYHGMHPRQTRPKALELLAFMALEEKARSEIIELSGGMKRRLMIARGLLNDPEILILDEPTTGLDPQARHLVWEKLRSLKRQGVTLLLTTHYMEEAAQLCDRLVIMNEAKILIEGSPRELIERCTTPEVVEIFEPPEDLTSELESLGSLAVRVERLADRWLFYTEQGDELLEKARTLPLPPGTVWLRGGTLEDVFLELTGRRLLE